MESLSEDVPQRKRRGPVPRLGVQVSVHINLPPELADWAKNEPEGMSGVIRLALSAERERRQSQGTRRRKDGVCTRGGTVS